MPNASVPPPEPPEAAGVVVTPTREGVTVSTAAQLTPEAARRLAQALERAAILVEYHQRRGEAPR